MIKNEKENIIPHNLSLENGRSLLKATGIAEVEGFDEKTVFAMTSEHRMTVKGTMLRVVSFSKEQGELTVSGKIDCVSYQKAISKKAGFFEKVFR